MDIDIKARVYMCMCVLWVWGRGWGQWGMIPTPLKLKWRLFLHTLLDVTRNTSAETTNKKTNLKKLVDVLHKNHHEIAILLHVIYCCAVESVWVMFHNLSKMWDSIQYNFQINILDLSKELTWSDIYGNNMPHKANKWNNTGRFGELRYKSGNWQWELWIGV